MMLHEINAGMAVRKRSGKRVGRGRSSGLGKTCGRGHKGSGQRAGTTGPAIHEGGRLPYFRRIPKRGFSNFRFRTRYQIVNLAGLAGHFQGGQTVDPKTLAERGMIETALMPVKVLSDGTLGMPLTVKAQRFSRASIEKIKAAGGDVEVLNQP